MNRTSGTAFLSVAVMLLASLAVVGSVSGWFDVNESLESDVSVGNVDADLVLTEGEIKTYGGNMVLATGFVQNFTVGIDDRSSIDSRYLVKLRFTATGPMEASLDQIIVDNEGASVFEDGTGFNFVFSKDQMPHKFSITVGTAITHVGDLRMTAQAVAFQDNMPDDEAGRL